MSFLFGSPGKMKQAPTLTGEQQQFLSQFLQQIMGGSSGQGMGESLDYLRGILSGDPEAFSAFEAPALRQFNEEILPSIAERFTAQGAGGGRSSANALAFAKAGESLSEKLAAQRAALQSGAAQQLLGNFNQQAGLGLGTKAFENYYKPASQGLLGQFAQGAGQGLGMAGSGGLSQGWNWLRSLFG